MKTIFRCSLRGPGGCPGAGLHCHVRCTQPRPTPACCSVRCTAAEEAAWCSSIYTCSPQRTWVPCTCSCCSRQAQVRAWLKPPVTAHRCIKQSELGCGSGGCGSGGNPLSLCSATERSPAPTRRAERRPLEQRAAPPPGAAHYRRRGQRAPVVRLCQLLVYPPELLHSRRAVALVLLLVLPVVRHRLRHRLLPRGRGRRRRRRRHGGRLGRGRALPGRGRLRRRRRRAVRSRRLCSRGLRICHVHVGCLGSRLLRACTVTEYNRAALEDKCRRACTRIGRWRNTPQALDTMANSCAVPRGAG